MKLNEVPQGIHFYMTNQSSNYRYIYSIRRYNLIKLYDKYVHQHYININDNLYIRNDILSNVIHMFSLRLDVFITPKKKSNKFLISTVDRIIDVSYCTRFYNEQKDTSSIEE